MAQESLAKLISEMDQTALDRKNRQALAEMVLSKRGKAGVDGDFTADWYEDEDQNKEHYFLVHTSNVAPKVPAKYLLQMTHSNGFWVQFKFNGLEPDIEVLGGVSSGEEAKGQAELQEIVMNALLSGVTRPTTGGQT